MLVRGLQRGLLASKSQGRTNRTGCPDCWSIQVGGRPVSLRHHAQFPQVGLCETTKFLQRVVLRHGKSADVGGKQAERHSLHIWAGVWGVLQAQHHAQEIGNALGHFWEGKTV